jgi:hypothetical protein
MCKHRFLNLNGQKLHYKYQELKIKKNLLYLYEYFPTGSANYSTSRSKS